MLLRLRRRDSPFRRAYRKSQDRAPRQARAGHHLRQPHQPDRWRCSSFCLWFAHRSCSSSFSMHASGRGGWCAPPDSRPKPEMNARTRSAVRSVGERPRLIWRIRFGSPSAILPNLVRLRPVSSRNAPTRVVNCFPASPCPNADSPSASPSTCRKLSTVRGRFRTFHNASGP